MAQSLFEHGSIKTTLPKAKEVQSFIEKLITTARKAVNAAGDEKGKLAKLNARRKVIAMMQDRRLVDGNKDFIKKGDGPRSVVEKLFDEVAPKFADRNGGYTRIIKTSKWRIGDGGSIVQLELITSSLPAKTGARKSASLRKKRTERKTQFAAKILKKFAKTEAAA